MHEDWEWDETLYRGSARYYRQGRLPYAPGLAGALARELNLDGRGRLLDVGCGPGIIAIASARHFSEVVGVDADQDMLEEARAFGASQGSANCRWAQLRAEDLPAGLGSFDVVTFAQSFHWMDRLQVARAVQAMLTRPNGALVHISAYTRWGVEPAGPMPNPRAPHDDITSLVHRYLGPAWRAGSGILNRDPPTDEDVVLSEAGFVGPQTVNVPDGRVLSRTVDDIVALVYSQSGSTPHLFGDRLAAFERELRGLLARASPTGLFSEQTSDTELRIWRPSARGASAPRPTSSEHGQVRTR